MFSMKKVITVVIILVLVAGLIFYVNSCRKDQNIPNNNTENKGSVVDVTPIEDPNSDSDSLPEDTQKTPDKKASPVYTGTGIYHGKVDTTFVEITFDDIQPTLLSCKLSPELAEKFSSLNLEPESIITFEYQVIDGQYVINKIIK